jgi:hypothetical protein
MNADVKMWESHIIRVTAGEVLMKAMFPGQSKVGDEDWLQSCIDDPRVIQLANDFGMDVKLFVVRVDETIGLRNATTHFNETNLGEGKVQHLADCKALLASAPHQVPMQGN